MNVDAASEMGARIDAQYASGQVDWDILQSADRTLIEVMARKGYIAKMPSDMKERLLEIMPENSVNDYGIVTGANGHLIICNMDVVETCPKSLAEFFDVDAFPYSRAIRGTAPIYPVSYASVANGMPPAQVANTDIDMDAAFKTLQRVKPRVTVWYTSSSQAIQAMQSGAADMAILNTGPSYQLAEAGNYELVWNDVARSVGSTVVLEKAPHKEEAFKFIEWIVNHPDNVAEWITNTGNSVGLPAALEQVDKNLLVKLVDNPDYADKSFDINVGWYADNKDELDRRWREFLGS